MSYWSKLSMKDKADVMRLFLDKGISDLDTIRREYNIFAEGGDTNDNDLVDWIIREEGFNSKPENIGDGKITLVSGLTDPKWHALYKKRGNKWSAEDNRMAVAEEVANRRRWAEKNIPNWDTLPDSAQKALLSYKYNYNFTSANSPKLFQALADSNLYEAAKQMDATSKDPKFKKGLMDRRKREQEWFLSDVAGNAAPTQATPVQTPVTINTSMIPLTELAVSTAVRNNYVPATTTPYNRGNNMRRAFESAVAFNRMMDATSLQNNPLPEYQFPISYAEGGKIHIDPSKKGTFTAAASRHGMGVQEFASKVLANKENYSPAMVKKANFARNASKWHGFGGNLYGDGGSYSYTKPLDNVIVDEYGNLIDPSVPSARGTVQLPEVIATMRDPHKPVLSANITNPNNISPETWDTVSNILDFVPVVGGLNRFDRGEYLEGAVDLGLDALGPFKYVVKGGKGAKMLSNAANITKNRAKARKYSKVYDRIASKMEEASEKEVLTQEAKRRGIDLLNTAAERADIAEKAVRQGKKVLKEGAITTLGKIANQNSERPRIAIAQGVRIAKGAPNIGSALSDVATNFFGEFIQKDATDPGSSFLLNDRQQEKFMNNLGYVKTEDEDGIKKIAKAVKALRDYRGRDKINIYQIGEDVVPRDSVIPVPQDSIPYNLGIDTKNAISLEHAGSYPTIYYKHKNPNKQEYFYRDIDLNDYGKHHDTSGFEYGAIQRLADLYDLVGNPFIQKTGIQRLVPVNGDENIISIRDKRNY